MDYADAMKAIMKKDHKKELKEKSFDQLCNITISKALYGYGITAVMQELNKRVRMEAKKYNNTKSEYKNYCDGVFRRITIPELVN